MSGPHLKTTKYRDFAAQSHGNAPNTPEIFKEGEEAHAEPALPGWRLSVDEVLEEAFPKQ